MRITTRGRYALRAALAMARLGVDGLPISIRFLSEREGISPIFLEQIFYRLRKAGIVESVRGPGGGFKFARPIEMITVKEILDASGEGLSLAPCTGEGEGVCMHTADCVSYTIWAEATKIVNDHFNGITLGGLAEQYGLQLDMKTDSCGG